MRHVVGVTSQVMTHGFLLSLSPASPRPEMFMSCLGRWKILHLIYQPCAISGSFRQSQVRPAWLHAHLHRPFPGMSAGSRQQAPHLDAPSMVVNLIVSAGRLYVVSVDGDIGLGRDHIHAPL